MTRAIAAAAVGSLALLGTACAGDDDVTDPGQIEPTVEQDDTDGQTQTETEKNGDTTGGTDTGGEQGDDGGLY